MDIDRRTNLILKHESEYRAFPMFQKMVDNTIYISLEDKYKSAIHVDARYGTELVNATEREAHGA